MLAFPALKTGSKLNDLESSPFVLDLLESIDKGKSNYWSSNQKQAWIDIWSSILLKNNQSVCPISSAFYSAILVYKKGSKYFIHAGANIDAPSRDLMTNPIYRNCAERQAAQSAFELDALNNSYLQMVFLYRKKTSSNLYPPEKLLPCMDCNAKYIKDLANNNGYLVLITDDNLPREFIAGDLSPESQLISTVSLGPRIVNYKILDASVLNKLKVESVLAGRIKNLA